MKYMIVFNNDRQEKSVYDISSKSGETRARDVVKAHQKKGRNITCSICDAIDEGEAIAKAKGIEPHYHQVPDTLADYH